MRPLTPLGLVAALAVLVAAHAPSTGIVSGVVTHDGEALSGANVLIVGTSIGTATDAEGMFEIRDVPAGAREVRVSFVGFESETVEVEVTEGERTVVEVELTEAASLEEIVVSGGRASGVRVRSGGTASDAMPSPPPTPPAAVESVESSRSPGIRMAREAPATSEASPADRRSDPRPDRRRPGLLTAGDIDDGLNWESYLGYVRRTLDNRIGQRQRPSDRGAFPDLGLSDRVVLRIKDEAGYPVAGARVTVEPVGRTRGLRARQLVTEAGTDGRLALFPSYDFGDVSGLRITVARPGGTGRARSQTVRLDRLDRLGDDRTVELRLPIRVAEAPRALDLAFVIDATGSMGDELRYLTDEFEHIVERLESRYPGVDLRFGLVAYRDRGDQFVTRRFDFTRSAQEMQRRLAGLRASGGGDYPEAMDEALEAALDLDWRTGTAARVAFLVADAPPHADRTERVMEAVREARARGLRLYPVAASGVADEAEYVVRAAAVLTQARHLFLTDDSGVGNAHAEPRIACYQVTALNSLLVRVVARELEGRRVESDRADVVREVGDYDAGVCESRPIAVQPRRQRDGDLGYVE